MTIICLTILLDLFFLTGAKYGQSVSFYRGGWISVGIAGRPRNRRGSARKEPS